MDSVVALFRSCSRPRALALAVMAVSVAGCSADTTRFNDSPFASRSPNEVTGSVPNNQGPVARVEQSQLPPPSGAQYAPPASAPPAGVSGGGRGMASYAPTSGPEITGSVQAPPPPRPVAHAPASRPATAAAPAHTGGSVHVVAAGDTLSKISRRYGKSVAEIARANNITPQAPLKIGDRITIPATRNAKAGPVKEIPKVAQAKPLAAAPVAAAKPAPVVAARPAAVPKQPQLASVEPAQSANLASPVETSAPATPSKAAADASPSFRWPVKGRVIAGFGPKTNGQQNDGINLAVPEGTPVKAAEDGVVAYAGNELKGYGNLVLVRHSNGYVTAYAHAKELLVKRGDAIKRGQVIAKSGQTGNVDAPQLHFEVRKGPSPMDPMPLLSGG